MIAQWRALDLDVLLTPMLGPAMDLNASGKASGESCCPTVPDTPTRSFSSMSSALCLVGPLGSRRGSLGEDLALEGLIVWLAGEMGVLWDALGRNGLPVLPTIQVGDFELQSAWFWEVVFEVQGGFR